MPKSREPMFPAQGPKFMHSPSIVSMSLLNEGYVRRKEEDPNPNKRLREYRVTKQIKH